MHAPITLSGKKYALNKVYVVNNHASKYVVKAFFSSKISIVSLVLTGYGFVLPCKNFVHLALLDHSIPDYTYQPVQLVWFWPDH